jgi:hypothetical protein
MRINLEPFAEYSECGSRDIDGDLSELIRCGRAYGSR